MQRKPMISSGAEDRNIRFFISPSTPFHFYVTYVSYVVQKCI